MSKSDNEPELYASVKWDEIEIEPERIERLRERMFDYALKQPKKIDIQDLCSRLHPSERLREQLSQYEFPRENLAVKDWMLRRWLILARYDLEKAFKNCVACFEFRNHYKVHLLRDPTDILPQEFYKVSPLWRDTVDKDGNSVCIVRVNLYRKIDKFDNVLKIAMLHLYEIYDMEYENKPYHELKIVLDMTNFNFLRDGNLDILQFFVTLTARYAGLFERVIVYELHWTMNFILALIKKWVAYVTGSPNDVVMLCKHQQLLELIDADDLPRFIKDGQKNFSISYPQEAIPFSVLAKTNRFYEMSDKGISEVYELLEKAVIVSH